MANEFKIKKGLIVTGASGGTVVDIQGSQGQLFSVTDNLSGSIFAVSDISGVPIFDVNSSGLSTFDGNLSISELIYHTGDIGTSIQMIPGQMVLKNSGGKYINLHSNGTTYFESSAYQFNTGNANFVGDVSVSGGDLNVGSSTTINSVINMLGTNDSFIEKDTGNHLYFANNVGDKDIKFRIKDDTTNVIALTIDGSEGGDSTFAAQAFSAATSSGDASSTLTTKGYVDGLITGATIYRGAWDPSGGGYGSPDLSGVTQTSGYYYICSAAGTAEPNGTGTEPDTWHTGDWVIYNDVSGTGQWQKIDNSSVLSGVGTGQTVALWEGAGSVTDSETLGNAPITVSGNNTTFAGNITAFTGAGSGNITVGRNSNEKTIIDVGDQVNSITAYQDSDGNATHNFTLDRVFGGTGANDFIIQKDGTAQFTLDTSANATFAGTGTFADTLSAPFVTASNPNGAANGSPQEVARFVNISSGATSSYMYIGASAGTDWRLGKNIMGTSSNSNFGIAKHSGSVLAMEIDGSNNTTFAGTVTSPTFLGDLNGTINTATTGVTQTAGDDSTKIATTAYADAAAAAVPIGNYLPLAGGTMTGAINAAGGLYFVGDSNMGFVPYPIGAQFRSDSAALTGYIKIELPTDIGTNPDDMVSFYVDVYDYTTNEMISLFIGGYTYTSGGAASSYWYNCTAIINTKQTGKDFDVKFGFDGTHFYVAIGETTSVWSHPSIVVRDVQCSYRSNVVHYIDGWDVSVTTTALVGVDETQTGNFPQAKHAATATSSVTQTAGDNSTLIATTAYADAAAAAVPIGDYLPLAGGTMTGNVIFPGEEANSFKIAFTGASASSGLSTVDQSGAGLYIGANSRVNTSGSIVFHDTLLPSSGIYFDGWSGDDMEFYTGLTGNPTKRLTINSDGNAIFTGNVGINQTVNPTNYTLEVNGAVEGDSFSVEGSPARIFAPSGAKYNGSGTQTGYLIVKLPDNGASGINNMMTGVIRVFDYTHNESFDVHFAGYWYSGYNWTNCSAWIESSANDDRNFTVRFGEMTGSAGANTRPYITIGEATSTWTYCKFSVINYEAGHSNYEAYKWNKGWSMDISATNPGNVLVTKSNAQVNNWARNGQDVYYGSGTGNVGIGTTSPGSKLELSEVSGGAPTLLTLHQNAVDIVADDTMGSFIDFKSTDINANFTPQARIGMLIRDSNGDNGVISEGCGNLVFHTSRGTDAAGAGEDVERMRITDIGNVGIGTSTPNAKLDVQGTQGQLFSVTDDLSGDIFSVADISGVPIMNVNSDGTSYFDGNVGIGTDSPDNKLFVTASTAGDYAAFIENTNSTNGYGLLARTAQTGTSSYAFAARAGSSDIFVVRGDGNVGIGTASPNTKLHVAGIAQVTESGNSAFYGGNYVRVFGDQNYGFRNTGGTYIANISMSGNSYFNGGNVGIGTTSPGAKLEISQGAGGTAQNVINSGEQAFRFSTKVEDTSTNTAVFRQGIYYNNTENATIAFYRGGSSVGGFMTFQTQNGNERMRIDSVGNVGIGTTSPATKLEVNGGTDAIVTITGTTTAARLDIKTDSYHRFLQTIESDGRFRLYNQTTATEQLTVTNAGNVGIGTASPDDMLEVYGSSPNIRVTNTAETDAGIVFNDAQAGTGQMAAIKFNSSDEKLKFFVNDETSQRMVIDTAGNVGIGPTISPSYLLDVRDGTTSGAIARFSAINAHVVIESSTAGNAVLHLKPNATGSKFGQFKVTAGNGYGFSWSNDAAGTGETTYMDLDTSSTGGGDLTVKGDVIAYGSPSDKKYKENIKPIESALGKAMQLQGVTFDWKDSDSILDIKEDIGFIAQDVQEVLPELVRDSGKGNLSLRYQGITPILLEAIKELKAEIDLLKSKPCNCNNCNCNI